jgi:hypothetical protein
MSTIESIVSDMYLCICVEHLLVHNAIVTLMAKLRQGESTWMITLAQLSH